MSTKLAIFDMDGTILYTLPDLENSLNLALSKHGYPTRTTAEIRSFVGNGVRKLVERGVPVNTPKDKIDLVFDTFFAHYVSHSADRTVPYDGIVELLQTLRAQGILTAVVSNKADGAVQNLCKKFFDGLFDCAVGERANIKNKPAPDSVYLVLDTLKVDKSNAIYIGDSDVDVATANNAGIVHIAVTWGYKDREELVSCGATLFADYAMDVLNYINR